MDAIEQQADYHGLTVRQLQVAMGIAEGKTLREIAKNLGIGYETTRDHRKRLGARLGLSNKVEIAVWVKENLSSEGS